MHSYDLPLSATSHLTCGSYMVTHLFILFNLFFSSTLIRKFCIHLIICILITMRLCPIGIPLFTLLCFFVLLILFTVASLLSFFPFIPLQTRPFVHYLFFIFLPSLFSFFYFVSLPKNASYFFLYFLYLSLSHFLPSFLLTSFYFFFFLCLLPPLGSTSWTVNELVGALIEIYCGNVGAEYLHIENEQQKKWLKNKIEGNIILNVLISQI